MNLLDITFSKYKWDVAEFVNYWRDDERSTIHKFVPVKAQIVCEAWIRYYAERAQDEMNAASDADAAADRRLYQYIRKSAFAVLNKEGDLVRRNPKFEEQTKRYMARCLDNTLEIFTVQWDELRKAIAAGSPYKRELQKIRPELADAFDSFSDASKQLHKSLKNLWLENGEFKDLPQSRL